MALPAISRRRAVEAAGALRIDEHYEAAVTDPTVVATQDR